MAWFTAKQYSETERGDLTAAPAQAGICMTVQRRKEAMWISLLPSRLNSPQVLHSIQPIKHIKSPKHTDLFPERETDRWRKREERDRERKTEKAREREREKDEDRECSVLDRHARSGQQRCVDLSVPKHIGPCCQELDCLQRFSTRESSAS